MSRKLGVRSRIRELRLGSNEQGAQTRKQGVGSKNLEQAVGSKE